MYLPLDVVKNHLNLDEDYINDDTYLIHLIKASEDAVAKRLNVAHLGCLLQKNTGNLPESVIHSVLLLIGSWYSARETFAFQNVQKLPHSFDFLCDLNRSYDEPF